MKIILLAAAFVLLGCTAEVDEAKRLGFANIDEMKEVHLKGWHTKEKFIADTQSNSPNERLSTNKLSIADDQEAKNENLVLIPNSLGTNVNACAEAYGIFKGYIEIAKINQGIRQDLESIGKPLKEIEVMTESTADFQVTRGLMSSKLRQGKSLLGVVYFAEASAAAQSGNYSKYMKELGALHEKYSKICQSALFHTS